MLNRRRDRLALLAVAGSAVVASFLEATLLITITLIGLRLTTDEVTAVSLPFGVPIDELSTGRLIAFGAVILLVRLGVSLVNLSITSRLSASTLYRWRKRASVAFMHTSWEKQQAEDEGHLQTISQTNISFVGSVVQSVGFALTALASFVTFVMGAFALHPVAAIGLFGFGGALFAMLRPLTTRFRKLAAKQKSEGQEFARQLGEIVVTSQEIRVFGREAEFSKNLDRSLLAFVDARRRQMFTGGMSPQLFQSAGLAVVLFGLAITLQLEFDDVALIGALVLLLIRSLSYGQTFQSNYQSIAGAESYIQGLLDAVEGYEAAALPSGTVSADRLGSLEFREASLGYSSTPILTDLSLKIQPGEAVGIIGPSGAGKSTLAASMLDLLRPQSGGYLADDRAVESLDRATWTSLMAFVPQEPKLFDGSVADNIAFHRTVSRREVESAARSAHLGRELDEWVDGLDYHVGPRGSRLSGGQKQRICIARALLGHPEVIMLDEPTAALDHEAEDSITDVLRNMKGDRTMIVIAHRLTTLEFCDRILLVDQGQVVELGTGAEIQNREGLRLLAESVLDQDESGSDLESEAT